MPLAAGRERGEEDLRKSINKSEVVGLHPADLGTLVARGVSAWITRRRTLSRVTVARHLVDEETVQVIHPGADDSCRRCARPIAADAHIRHGAA